MWSWEGPRTRQATPVDLGPLARYIEELRRDQSRYRSQRTVAIEGCRQAGVPAWRHVGTGTAAGVAAVRGLLRTIGGKQFTTLRSIREIKNNACKAQGPYLYSEEYRDGRASAGSSEVSRAERKKHNSRRIMLITIEG